DFWGCDLARSRDSPHLHTVRTIVGPHASPGSVTRCNEQVVVAAVIVFGNALHVIFVIRVVKIIMTRLEDWAEEISIQWVRDIDRQDKCAESHIQSIRMEGVKNQLIRSKHVSWAVAVPGNPDCQILKAGCLAQVNVDDANALGGCLTWKIRTPV